MIGGIGSRPSTVGVGSDGRRRSRHGDRTSPAKHKKSIRKYINTDLSSSNENDVQFYNKDSTHSHGSDGTRVNNTWRSATPPVESHHSDISTRKPSGGRNNEESGVQGEEYDVDGTLRKNR